MSIATEIMEQLGGEVRSVDVDRDAKIHGEDATEVVATLADGRTVTGTFVRHSREGFGGVQFSAPKDVAGLMVSKIRDVLAGTAEVA
jgi:hypothetical protein